MGAIAEPFAAQVQCSFLGWPPDMQVPLRQWTSRNQRATLAQDRAALAKLAREFDEHVKTLLQARETANSGVTDDATSRLMRSRVGGRPLTTEEIVSVLRNWTVGEIGTISSALGILAAHVASDAELQNQLRNQSSLIPAAVDEILRIHGPLIANRRVATRPVVIRGRHIAAGERLSLMWPSANRDEDVFPDAATLRLERNQSFNLLYGAGIHVCPGAYLARMELRVVLEELLMHTTHIAISKDSSPAKAVYPASGYSSLVLRDEP